MSIYLTAVSYTLYGIAACHMSYSRYTNGSTYLDLPTDVVQTVEVKMFM